MDLVWLQEHTLKRHVFERDKNVYTKYDNHSMPNLLEFFLEGHMWLLNEHETLRFDNK